MLLFNDWEVPAFAGMTIHGVDREIPASAGIGSDLTNNSAARSCSAFRFQRRLESPYPNNACHPITIGSREGENLHKEILVAIHRFDFK